MNPLTQVKNTQKITAREQAIGISEDGSWHAKYKDSAYVYVGGLPFDLTEGDVLAVFAQYGEIVDVNLVRDKATGKSKGFAFLAYEDQRSTVLAVDNLNGARVVGRIIKVDHVGDYKRKLEEDEEEKQKKREERGVCYAFQRGECNRGDDCKFSHDEERNANTGWGGGGAGRGDGGASWKHDQFDGSMKEAGRRMNMQSTKRNDNGIGERDEKPRGVCYAFQRGECNRGDGCKFAHDEQKNTDTGRGGGGPGGAGRENDQFDGSMREAGRRMNITNTVSTKRNEIDEREEISQRGRDADRGDREKEDGHRKRDGDREDRGRDDVQRRREGDQEDREDRGRDDVQRRREGDQEDREDRGRDDVQRRRDGAREARGREQDRKESDRRVRRDDYREGSYERKDPRDDGDGKREDRRDDRRNDRRGRDDDQRDRSRDVRKERERSDRGDDGRGERSVRSRR